MSAEIFIWPGGSKPRGARGAHTGWAVFDVTDGPNKPELLAFTVYEATVDQIIKAAPADATLYRAPAVISQDGISFYLYQDDEHSKTLLRRQYGFTGGWQ